MRGTMNTATKDRLLALADRIEGSDHHSDPSHLLSHTSLLLDDVQVLESAASAWREGELDPQVLRYFAAALNSLATFSLLLDPTRGAAGDVRSSQLLSAVNQNLRLAADAAELAGEALADGAGDRAS
jgi:hypothetical protein